MEKSLVLINEAAKEGDREAQYILGYAYKFGNDVVLMDMNKAFSLFKMAAEQGQKDAQYEVGTAYEQGWGDAIMNIKENKDKVMLSTKLVCFTNLGGVEIQKITRKR